MLGKSTIIILEEVSEVVSNGDLIEALSKKVSCSSREQSGEGQADVSLTGELIDGCFSKGWPYESVRRSTQQVFALSLAVSFAV